MGTAALFSGFLIEAIFVFLAASSYALWKVFQYVLCLDKGVP